MSDYDRTTRDCPVSQLNPEVLKAFRNYFQDHTLGDLETETLACCETISIKKDLGNLVAWLNATVDATIYTGILLTSQQLIWVRSGDTSGVLLAAAYLTNISVRIYTPIFTKDTVLEISGYMEGSKGAMRGFIGMGPEVATENFCDAVNQAIKKVNPPKKVFGQSGWEANPDSACQQVSTNEDGIASCETISI